MKQYEDKNMIIKYHSLDEDNIQDIINVLTNRSQEIMSFFKLESLTNKVKIVIWDSIEGYKQNISPYLKQENREYQSWMIADTFDGNINMLSIQIAKKSENHPDYSQEEFLENICHEFTHICHREVAPINTPGWIYEMVATNLGNYNQQCLCPIDVSLDDLTTEFDYLDNNYNIAYTMGQYLIKQYGTDKMFELITSEEQLEEHLPTLFNEAQTWSKTQRRTK